MVRSGHHCCQPLTEYLGLPDGTVRASLALYNNHDEIDMLLATLEELTEHNSLVNRKFLFFAPFSHTEQSGLSGCHMCYSSCKEPVISKNGESR